MPDWRDNLRPASFRGVPFEVLEHDYNGGRRGPLHEYSGRDKPYFEDLGRKARGTTVSAFVIGDDYTAKRDRLIEACEKEGPGTLVHPYLGSMQVACTDFSLHENYSKGRMASISMVFVEAGELSFPKSEINSAAIVGDRSDDLVKAADIVFAKKYAVKGLPGFVPTSIETAIQQALDLAKISTASGDVQNIAESMKLNISGLVRNAPDLSLNLQSLISGIGAGKYTGVLSSLSTFSPDTSSIAQTTATRVAQVENLDAVGGLVRNVSLAKYGTSIIETDYSSYQDANAAATEYVALVENEIQTGPAQYDDDLYNALSGMSEAVFSAVSEKSEGLAQITTTSFLDSKPALVLAYELWEDAARDQEIVDRNNIIHPSFLPPNTDLEILST